MGTIDDRKTIEQIIKNDGRYSDDPPIDYVVEYRNMAGNICWGVIYSTERYRYGEYVALPESRVVFDRLARITRGLRKK